MEARAGAATQIAQIGNGLKAHAPFGSTRVLDVAGELTTDQDGEAVLRLRLILSDPPDGSATWSLDDVDELQQEADRLARQAEIEFPYVVTELYPASPDPAEATSDDSAAELAGALDDDMTS